MGLLTKCEAQRKKKTRLSSNFDMQRFGRVYEHIVEVGRYGEEINDEQLAEAIKQCHEKKAKALILYSTC
jgi:hypothetical protein